MLFGVVVVFESRFGLGIEFGVFVKGVAVWDGVRFFRVLGWGYRRFVGEVVLLGTEVIFGIGLFNRFCLGIFGFRTDFVFFGRGCVIGRVRGSR